MGLAQQRYLGIESKKMAKLMEMVRNSPLMHRRGSGGYKILDSENKDPFVKGIPFTIYYYVSAPVEHTYNTPDVQQAVLEACEESKKTSKTLRKVVLTVKASFVSVRDVATNIKDDYPIYLIAYCGGHEVYEDTFFFIHKTKLEKMRVEVFKCSSQDQVKAITLTAAKAFNIAFKTWSLEKKREMKSSDGGAGCESPSLQRKALPSPGNSSLVKIAPGIATGGTHTPPAPRKSPADTDISDRSRSGSFGDMSRSFPKHQALVKTIVCNEATGGTHNAVLMEDFDRQFQELAESRVTPDVLRTSLALEETDGFNLDSIMHHVDEETGTSWGRKVSC